MNRGRLILNTIIVGILKDKEERGVYVDLCIKVSKREQVSKLSDILNRFKRAFKVLIRGEYGVYDIDIGRKDLSNIKDFLDGIVGDTDV